MQICEVYFLDIVGKKSNYLVLPNDNAKSLDKLKEKIVDYWDDEEKRPKEGCTHIIINSPRVIERRLIRDKDEQIREKNGEINELCEEFDRLMTKGGPNILKNAYKIGKIKMGDEVRYGKDHVCFLSAIDFQIEIQQRIHLKVRDARSLLEA
ncbi:hypothetical protein RhiirA4_442499 [Rhizophagus irregularis]|uniref:Uncharacterized protein n=1 Tax=Rhizophagus irregularis TaxID=588596 RepID=A0A2I1G9N8_9GLOM|nr:hypothetical protein RhiirA4_442499 [Rhizophagus irregularis]